MSITHNCKSTWRHLQQEVKGKRCIAIHAKIIYIYLTIILRNRAEYRPMLSLKSRLKSDDIPQD